MVAMMMVVLLLAGAGSTVEGKGSPRAGYVPPPVEVRQPGDL